MIMIIRAGMLFVMLFILSLVCASLVVASETIISGEYFTGDSINVDNKTFILIGTDPGDEFFNNYSSVIFKDNATKAMFKVQKGRCYNTEYYEYCFNDSYYNWDKKFTYAASTLQPSLIINVYYYKPEVAIEKITSIELDYDRGYFIELKFTNTGSKDTTVHYTEQLPAQFLVLNCQSCEINYNKVTAEIRLAEGEERTVYYTIRYAGYSSFTWNSSYDYTYDNVLKSEVQTTTSTVKIPYAISESLTNSVSTALGDKSTFFISFENIDPYANIKLKLKLMNDAVDEYTGLTKINNSYYYEGFINSKDSKNFSITMDSIKVGEFPIFIDSEIESHNIIFNYDKNYTFNVSLSPLVPSIIVDKEQALDNDTITMVASLKNTDEYAQYLYVYAYIDIFDQQWTFYKINPGKELILYNNTFNVPFGDDDLYITLSGVYRTQNLQDQTFRTQKIVDIIGREPKTFSDSELDALNETDQSSVVSSDNEQSSDLLSNQSPDQSSDVITDVQQSTQSTTAQETIEEDDRDFLTKIISSIDNFFKNMFG